MSRTLAGLDRVLLVLLGVVALRSTRHCPTTKAITGSRCTRSNSPNNRSVTSQ